MELSQGYVLPSCSGILKQLLQGVVKCLKPLSELPFGSFFIQKIRCLCFSKLCNKSCTELAQRGQYGLVPMLHGH